MKKRLQKFDTGILIILDILAVIIAGFISENMAIQISFGEYLKTHTEVLYIIFPFLITTYLFDLYYPLKDFRRYRTIVTLMLAVFLFAVIVIVIDAVGSLIGHPPIHNRWPFLIFFLLLLFLSVATRVVFSLLRKRIFGRNAIIVGSSEISTLLLDCIAEEEKRGNKFVFRILGYVADNGAKITHFSLPRLGSMEQIPEIRARHDISLLIYALDTLGDSEINELIVREKLKGAHLISAVGLYESIAGRIPYAHIDSAWLIEECLRGNKFTQNKLKNLVDKVLGAVLLVLSFPLIFLCAIVMKLASAGPVFFAQERIGRFGKPFTIYKLRTMQESGEAQPDSTEGWHDRQESRITRLGALLRRCHLDEFPQFFNVLKGDMSLVGPRPEMEMFIRACEDEIPFYRLRLDVKPGITGWAQVAFRHTSSLDAYKEKFEYELYYLSHLSLRFDLEILARTIFILLFKPSR